MDPALPAPAGSLGVPARRCAVAPAWAPWCAAPAARRQRARAGAEACPYSVGARDRPAGGGGPALSRGRRGGRRRQRLRGRPAQLRGAEVQPGRRLRGRVGLLRGGPGPVRADRSDRRDAAGNVYVVDSSHDRIEKFAPSGAFITAWGHRGSGLGEFHFGSSQNPTQPPGGGIAVAGTHVFVADTLNNRIERFNLEGGEAVQWGSPRQLPRPVRRPPRAGGERKRAGGGRRRQPPHPEVQPRRRLGGGSRRTRPRAGPVQLPLRRRPRRRRRRVRGRQHQRPRGEALPRARLPRRVGRPGLETRPARLPAGDRGGPRRGHIRDRHRQRADRGVRP